MLVLGKEPTQGFEHTLTAEKLYNINFTVSGKKIWVCIIMVIIVICLLMGLNNLNLK